MTYFLALIQTLSVCDVREFENLRNHALRACPYTVDTGYMVIGYKVKSDIRSILGWYGFPYTKNYWIYGQISDIWSEILIKLKTKAIESGVF